MDLSVDHDLQAALTRALNSPFASHIKPAQQPLHLYSSDDQLFVSRGLITKTYPIMSATMIESVAPSSPGPALSLNHDSPVVIVALATTIKDADLTMASLASNIEMAKAKVDLANKELGVYISCKSLDERMAALNVLEGEVDLVALGFETKVAQMTTECEIMASKLKHMEGNKQNWVFAVQFDKGENDLDKMNLRKTELEIMDLKCAMVRKEIEIMEANIALKEHNGRTVETDSKRSEAQRAVQDAEAQFTNVKNDLKIALKDFKAKFGADALADDIFTQGRIIVETELLKEKIEEMQPLYWVGHAIRIRYMEGELKGLKGQPVNRDVEIASQEAWKQGKAQADASTFLESAGPSARGVDDFVLMYGILPEVVWEHREFGMFMNILSWKMDARRLRLAHKPDVFYKNYDILFNKIVPAFDIKSDDDITNDAELLRLYMVLKEEHDKAISTTQPKPQHVPHGGRQNYNNYERRNDNNYERRNGNRS